MSRTPKLGIRIDEDTNLCMLEERHAQELYDLVDANRAHLREWLPWVDYETSVEDSKAFIKHALQQFASNEGFQLGIWYKEQLAGVIGYHPINWPNRKVEIGYWLAQSFQGKGLMTKACKTLVTYAFDELGLNKVFIQCATGNSRSCAIPKRLGFTQEGILRDAEWLYDHYVDHVIFGMLTRDWHADNL
jgi:ribosomal-protein-serine acetyltransferase